jgi:tetratricopeptide (TPR) repeat protein
MIRANYIKSLVSILTFAILIAISYSNTIKSPFQFDDYHNIVDNNFIKISSLHIEDLARAAANSPSNHRWIPNISFAVQYYFSALKTPDYHYFNIAIHFFCATILYFLIITTLNYTDDSAGKSRKYEIAFVATILWSLHPLQTNAVTYIVQRMTSISTLFYLSAIFLYAKGRLPDQTVPRKYLLFSASMISVLLALTSKENAATLPLMIIAYEIFFITPERFLNNRRQAAFAFGGAFLLLLVLGWLWIGRDVFEQILQGYETRYFSLSERLLTEPRVIFYYIVQLFFPALSLLNINHDILISTTPLSPPTTIPAICGILLLIYSIRYLFNKDRILSFAILWFLLNLVIESSIIPLELCFEHRMYLPSTILIFAFVLLIYRSAWKQIPLVRMGMFIIAVSLGILTWNRNIAWQSTVSLWSDSQSKSPNLIRTYANLGYYLRNANQLPQAEAYLIKALALDATRKIDHNHPVWKKEMSGIHDALATVYREQNNFPKARYHSEEALRLNPTSQYALLTRGILFVKEGDYKSADAIFIKLASTGMDTVDLSNNWGICAFNTGEIDRAIFLFRHALKIDPNHAESHYNLGVAYGSKGMRDEARREMAFGMQL